MLPERERARVVLAGELDLATADDVEHEARGLLDRGFGEVVLDLRDLTFIDSSGIRALLSCTREARNRAARLSVVLGPGAVTRAVELCGVREQLDVVEPA